MRFFTSWLIGVCFANSLIAQETLEILKPAGGPPVSDIASYAIGLNLGATLAGEQIVAADINKEDLLRGIFDSLDGKELAVAKEQLQTAMEAFSQKMHARYQEKVSRNLEVANKFLEENKKKEGVQVTQSGLQYKVITAGTGATPDASKQVTVHYEGKLLNGRVFDSSIQRGQPTTFGVTQVIPGWTEALQRMKVGDKWVLYIPPNLAYGEQGAPRGGIGPNEALIFEVELLEVK